MLVSEDRVMRRDAFDELVWEDVVASVAAGVKCICENASAALNTSEFEGSLWEVLPCDELWEVPPCDEEIVRVK